MKNTSDAPIHANRLVSNPTRNHAQISLALQDVCARMDSLEMKTEIASEGNNANATLSVTTKQKSAKKVDTIVKLATTLKMSKLARKYSPLVVTVRTGT